MGKPAIGGSVIICGDLNNKRRKRRMYRSARLKASLAKMCIMLVFCVFTYVVVDDHLQKSTKIVEINVSNEWLEGLRQHRSVLITDTSSSAHKDLEDLNNQPRSIDKIIATEQSIVALQTEKFVESDAQSDPTDEELIETALSNFPQEAPNSAFIFHNKLPKSGSTTMNNIFKVLKRRNGFNFLKLDPIVTPFHDPNGLAKVLKDKINPPYLLLKHHYWMNFTNYNMEQPTYINVVRHPLDWFTSHYYFHRYGWKRKPGCRVERCGMTADDFNMTIDECVAKRHKQCMIPWMYIPFFCGSGKECIEINNAEQKRKSLQIAKARLVKDYYFVGILEQFEDTLQAFEQILPKYFKGARDAWRGDFVQMKQNQTRTMNRREMSEESEAFFKNGPLKYEIELYEFAKKLFDAKLTKLGVISSNNSDFS